MPPAGRYSPALSPTQRQVYEAVIRGAPGGLTDEEIARVTGLLRSAVCGRRNELVALGLLTASSQRRRSEAGVRSVVWIALAREDGGCRWCGGRGCMLCGSRP